MKIYNTPIKYYSGYSQRQVTKPTFRGGFPVETIKHYNLGMMPNGIIGKVKVLKKNGEEVFLNVSKQATALREVYRLQDDFDRVIGKIEVKIRKETWDPELYPPHVFVDELRNYSHPGTPYHMKDLDEYKHVGIRLLQIAQRRSDEAACWGNIQLVSKNESMEFYKKLGFQKIPTVSRFENPNSLYLPAEAKEPLSKIHGGL